MAKGGDDSNVIAKWTEFYKGNCPKCGGGLNPPDENNDRYCKRCHLTVEAAVVTLEDA